MQTTSAGRKNYNRSFMRLIVFIGGAVCLFSAWRFPVERIDLKFLFLATVAVFLGSRIGIEFSRQRVQITASDIFVFLTLLLYGGEAAVLIAAAEAFCSSFRFSKLWLTRFFNSALLACATFLTSVFVSRAFGSPVELTYAETTPKFVLAVCALALVQYLANSSIAAIRESLKTEQPLWKTWKEFFLWTGVTYFASASAAGMTAKLITGNGFYAFVAVIPIISIIYFTYQSYRKQLEAKIEQAEQAECHAREQERITQVLRQSEEHFRGAFDYAAVGMTLIGIDGRWLRVNQSFCNLVGYSEEELLEMDFQSITHPDDLGNNLADMYRMIEKKAVRITTEKRYIHKQGHEVWTIISASAVTDAEGKPIHLITQAQDITERKKAEAKLHHAAFYD